MSNFVLHTMNDIRGGRESWRVFVALGTPAFAIAIAFVAVQQLF